MKELKPALILTSLFVVFTGLIFPGVVWLGSQLIFPFQANGSFIKDGKGNIVGSELIGQNFSLPKYFHPRPSAAGAGYDAANSSGTNLGPVSAKLIQGITDDPLTVDVDETYIGVSELTSQYIIENGISLDVKLPADAVTHSASGLDPDISPANASLQVNRVAQARGISPDQIHALVKATTQERFLGIWGEPRVNVLKLNLKLDEKFS